MADDTARTEPDGHAAADRSGRRRFSQLAHVLTEWTGTGWAAAAIAAAFALWIAVGAFYHFSRWWELGATVGLPFLTLLMLSLVQHTQNHNALATHLKLDELIRVSESASNRMMTVEHASRDDLDRIQADFRRESWSEPCRQVILSGKRDDKVVHLRQVLGTVGPARRTVPRRRLSSDA